MTSSDPYVSIRMAKAVERHILFSLRGSPANRAIVGASGSRPVRDDGVHPEVLAWYKPLTDKSIQSLQLHKTGHLYLEYFVVLVLGDGSILRLHGSDPHKALHEHHRLGVARNVSDLNELVPETLLTVINITRDNTSDSPIVDMRFILAVCHGIHHSSNPPLPDNKLFALALTACVARKCLRVETHITGKTKTPLDDLWQGAHSPKPGMGDSLWEDHIAEETRRKVHKIVSKLATEQVMQWLHPLSETQNPEPREDKRDANKSNIAEQNSSRQPIPLDSLYKEKIVSNAASIVAWVESTAQKRQAVKLETWDRAWDRAWGEKWSKTWESEWSKLGLLKVPRSAGKIGKLGELLAVVGTASADGRVSGKTAGRAPIDASAASQALESRPTLPPAINISYYNGDKEADSTQLKFNGASPTQLEEWRSERYPILQQKWAPVWQTASDMAWKLTWEIAERAGKQESIKLIGSHSSPERPPAVDDVTSTQGKASIANTKPKAQASEQVAIRPGGDTGLRPARFGKVVATVVTNLRQTKRNGTARRREQRGGLYERELEVEKQVKEILLRSQPKIPSGLVARLAEHAWNEARLVPGSAEAELDEWAKHALRSTRRLNSVLPYLAKLMPLKHQGGTEDIWEKVFASTWEITWKRSWEAAWTAVWEESTRDAWEKGIQAGINEAFPSDQTASLSETGKRAYGQLKDDLSGETEYSGTLWKIRSSFEALTQLHDALFYSVPTYHEEVMDIKISPKRNFYSTIGDKLDLTEGGNQVPTKATHARLQDEIKRIIKHDTLSMSRMSKIWTIATDVYQDSGFLPSDQDLKEHSEPKANSDPIVMHEYPSPQKSPEPVTLLAEGVEVKSS